MSVGWIGAAVGVLGIATSAMGSAKSASDTKHATADANLNAHMQELNRLIRTQGPEKGLATWRAGTDRRIVQQVLGRAAEVAHASPEQMAQIVELNKQIDGLKANGGKNMYGQANSSAGRTNLAAIAQLEAQRDNLVKETGAHPAIQGLLDEGQIKQMGPGLAGEYTALADEAGKTNQRNLSTFDNQTTALDRQSRDIERYASRWGQGQESRIRRDSERSLSNANAAANAALTSRGLGASSALTDAFGGNAEANQRATSDALGTLSDQQLSIGTGLRTGRLGMASSRASGRESMMVGGQANQQGLRVGALNVQQSALLGDTPYYPGSGASPSGAAMQSAGNSLAAGGSAIAGYGLQDYLRNLRRPSASSGNTVRSYNDGGLYDTGGG